MIFDANMRARFIFVIALLLSLRIPALSSADADSVFKENTKAVVVVIAHDKQGNAISQGSGFIVRHGGLL